MGIYPQPNDWTCGPFALKHALVALGSLADDHALTSVVRPHWWAGVDEVRLAKAARSFGADMGMIRRRTADGAKRALVAYLRKRLPVLLCVDDWGHWITAVRYENQRFVVFDSKLDPVMTVLTWPQLRSRWRYFDHEKDEDDPPEYYDLHPVKPRPGSGLEARAHFSVARVRYLRRSDKDDLAIYWDAYLEDLLEICRPRTARMVDVLSMKEFFRRYHDMLVARVTYWHGGAERDEVAGLLKNFQFVADTYGLVIPAGSSRRALTDLAILVSFWVVANRGVGDMYGSGDELGRVRKPRGRRRRRS